MMQQQVLGRIFTMHRRSVGNISPPIPLLRQKEQRNAK